MVRAYESLRVCGPDELGVPADWPLRSVSRGVTLGSMRWHVQQLGSGPPCLMLHGTGASTHTFRDLAPLLAEHFTLLMPDLPGHGFTDACGDASPSLDNMARAVSGLMRALKFEPTVVVGHSAGAAVATNLVLGERHRVQHLCGLNGAFFPFNEGVGALFSGAARLFSIVPGLPRLLTLKARDMDAVTHLMRSTGSEIDARGVALYAALLRDPNRVKEVLRMMGHWDLSRLVPDMVAAEQAGMLPRLHLLIGDRDRTVPPTQAQKIQSLIPSATLDVFAGFGHLAHEEAPARTAGCLLAHCERPQAPPGQATQPSESAI